jgi:hypothetical protein
MSNLKRALSLAVALCAVPLTTMTAFAGETHSSSMAGTQNESQAPVPQAQSSAGTANQTNASTQNSSQSSPVERKTASQADTQSPGNGVTQVQPPVVRNFPTTTSTNSARTSTVQRTSTSTPRPKWKTQTWNKKVVRR